MPNNFFHIWLDAARPRTLPLALACIISGTALASKYAPISWPLFSLTLLTALLLQILSNLANDYGDSLKGTDNQQRLGPKRTMQQGLISSASMKKAIFLNILLILLSGGMLILTAFNNLQDILMFAGFGLLAIVAAICYTLGSKPYGYQGLGDISVFIFFGLLGVGGCYYLQAGAIHFSVLLPAIACGLLAVAVLNINNLRDIDNDRLCGKLTLAVKLGTKGAKIYHQLLLAGAYLSLIGFNFLQQTKLSQWLFIAALPVAIKHGMAVWRAPNAQAIAPMMADVVKVALLTNLLFAIGIWLP